MSDRIAESFADLRHWLDDPDAYPDDFISIHIELVPKVLTPNRTRLLAELQRHGPADSVEDLARRLGRNYASVSRDVGYLAGVFLDVDQIGHRKQVRASPRPIIITGATSLVQT